ncbi:MAG: transposase [Nitrospirota bacterium]|nr:transposase [Nitrospirota bacterium]
MDYTTYLREDQWERNLVERVCGYLKHFRLVATRYDKTARSFLSFVQLAASDVWLK